LPDLSILTDRIDPAFNTWRIQINSKLTTNADHYIDKTACIHYVFSCTGGDAQGHLKLQFGPDTVKHFQTTNSMIKHLVSIYKDLFQMRNVYRDYCKLMIQSTETFTDFYIQFLHLVSKGQILDKDLCPDLYNKLILELQCIIVLTEGTFDNLKDLQKALLYLDQNLCYICDCTDCQTKTWSTLSTEIPPSLEKTMKTSGILTMKPLSVNTIPS
jgi:hypothetical protein